MGRYRRTISFPNPSPFTHKPETKSIHVRSASLPCTRSNPLINQLHDQLTQLRSISMNHKSSLSSVSDTLAQLKAILDSLDDFLQLQQTLDSLSSSTTFIEKLLEEFLKFVDVYGIFQASLLGLKQELAEAQLAIRHKDASKLGLHVKAQKKIAHHISKLVGSISMPFPPENNNSQEVSDVICQVHGMMSSVSSGLFTVAHASFGPAQKPRWAGLGPARGLFIGLRRKGSENGKSEREDEIVKKGKLLKKMQEMEDSVGEMEKKSGGVLRSLISTRVSLLNILTHASD